MSGLTLTLKSAPTQRLDLAQVTPEKLKGMSEREVASLSVGVVRDPVPLGDVFTLRMGDPGDIRISGATDKLDNIGRGMSCGAITVEGSVGAYAGCHLSGGKLVIRGNAGPWIGAGQSGGQIEITGNAGDSAGGALPGVATGMRGGVLLIRGASGAKTGDRMRRGLLIVDGRSGAYLGARMVAGTIIAMEGAGDYPGYLMGRGTIFINGPAGEFGPGFMDCGRQELTLMRLMAKQLSPVHGGLTQVLSAPLRRYAGDMAALGKGEIFRVES